MSISIRKDTPWDVLREKTEGDQDLRSALSSLRLGCQGTFGGKEAVVIEEGDNLYPAAKMLQEAGLLSRGSF